MLRSMRLSSRAVLRALLMLGSTAPALMIGATSVEAQDYTNIAASGRVTGQDGTAIVGAQVKITSSDRGVSRVAATDSTGSYTIPQLPPGNYDVAITAPGFASY
ncbi:MAG: carboxypeptidase regulatory-like domain-containing protein, partial [Sphingomonas sp.]